MATMTIEYNERNKYTRQLLAGLLGSGIIRRQNINKEHQKITEFKTALQESKEMEMDIVINGTSRYKTLDDLLNEE